MPPRAPARGTPSRLCGGAAVVIALAVGAAGCGAPASGAAVEAAAVFPFGTVETDARVLCAPSRDWASGATAGDEGDGAWSFRGVAEVACLVRRPPGPGESGGLTLRLVPAAAAAGLAFALSWDGEPVAADPGELPALAVRVPAERAGPGLHLLEIERRPRPADAARPRNVFAAIELVAGDDPPWLLPPAAAERFAYLADFLALGGAGLGPEKTDGVLFVGPRRLVVEVPDGPARELTAWPENVSDAPAAFTAAAGGVERRVVVPPRGRQRLAMTVPAGARAVRLDVRGRPGGLFLWGAPRLAAADRRERGTPVVLVTLDTTRRDALGVYGAGEGATPHLDRFARRATVYDDAWTTAPWTLPSHASIFTGRWPGRHGAGVGERRLPRGLPTLASTLRRHGWSAAGFAGGELASHRFGLGRGFDLYRDPAGLEETAGPLTDRVVAYLEAAGPAPPFLFVNYFDPHYPYAAPPALQARLGVPARAGELGPAWAAVARGERAAWARAVEGETPLTPPARAWLRAVYLAEVAWMDEQIGRLLAELERRDLFDRAVVAVVADHGELLGEGGLLSHAYRLDPELVRVPLLVKWPGQRRGRRVDDLVSVVDLFPTLLAAAGVAPPASDGLPLPRGDGEATAVRRRRHVFSEEHVSRVHPLPSAHRFLAADLYLLQGRTARQVVWEGGRECGRAAADGGWRPAPCPGDGARVLAALVQRLGRPPAPEGRGAGELDEAVREELAALGYL